MNRRNALAVIAASPALASLIPDDAAAAPGQPPPSLGFVEWLLLHPGAREVDGAPGWFVKYDGPEETGAPIFKLHVRHREGREFDFHVGMYTRAIDGTPFNSPWSWSVLRELHQRYPDEYPEAPTASEWDRTWIASWPVTAHLDAALGALVEQKDMALFARRIEDAARAMGVDQDGLRQEVSL